MACFLAIKNDLISPSPPLAPPCHAMPCYAMLCHAMCRTYPYLTSTMLDPSICTETQNLRKAHMQPKILEREKEKKKEIKIKKIKKVVKSVGSEYHKIISWGRFALPLHPSFPRGPLDHALPNLTFCLFFLDLFCLLLWFASFTLMYPFNDIFGSCKVSQS
jgi:hypothetical protein